MSRLMKVGAASFILIAAVALALGWSGFIPAFGRNRGLLQVTVAIPATCAAAGLIAGRWTDLGPRALALAVLPLVALALALGGGFAGDLYALPAVAALAGVAAVPWLVGVATGSWWARRRTRGHGPPDPE